MSCDKYRILLWLRFEPQEPQLQREALTSVPSQSWRKPLAIGVCPVIFLMQKYSQYFLALYLNNYRVLHFSLFQVLSLHLSLPILIQNKKQISSFRIWPVRLHKPGGRSPCPQPCFFPFSWRFFFGPDPFPAPSHRPHWPLKMERSWIEPLELKLHRWCTVGLSAAQPGGHCRVRNQLTKIKPFE